MRGDVMDTRLMIWCTRRVEPVEDSFRDVDFNRLKLRFSVCADDSDGESASPLSPANRTDVNLKIKKTL